MKEPLSEAAGRLCGEICVHSRNWLRKLFCIPHNHAYCISCRQKLCNRHRKPDGVRSGSRRKQKNQKPLTTSPLDMDTINAACGFIIAFQTLRCHRAFASPGPRGAEAKSSRSTLQSRSPLISLMRERITLQPQLTAPGSGSMTFRISSSIASPEAVTA